MRQCSIEVCFLSLVFGSVLAVVVAQEETTFLQKSHGTELFNAAGFDTEEDGMMSDVVMDVEEDGKVIDAVTPPPNKLHKSKKAPRNGGMTGAHARKLQFGIPKFPGIPKNRKNKCKTLKDANGCGGMCPSDYILALLPDPTAQTCPKAGWRIPYPKFQAFPGMDFLMAKSLELALGSVGMYTNAKLGKDAVHVRFCDGFVGMAENMRFCVVKFNLAKVMPRIGGKKLFETNVVFCFAFTPSLSPFIATAFTNLGFDFWPLPFSIGFTGTSLSLDGCLEIETRAYLTSEGVVVTGRKLNADMGLSVEMSWGVGVPFFRLAVVFRAQVHLSLDPRKDGQNTMPHNIILQLMRQECSPEPHPATDWQFWIQTQLSLELTVAGRFVFTFPFKLHSQIFIDSDSKNTNIYISFAIATINDLSDLLGSDYRKVQKHGGEKFACITLAYKTGLSSKYIPYCKDFIFFKQSISVFITYEKGQSSIALSFNEGAYTARIKRRTNGYDFCLNEMCQRNMAFSDSDCANGYTRHNVGSNASWVCRRVQVACFCVTHYSQRPFGESCSGACYKDTLLHSTADKHCKKRGNGGSAYCVDGPSKPIKVDTNFCNKTVGSRRLASWFGHKRRMKSRCPGSRRLLKRSCRGKDQECFLSAGPSTCVRGRCRCRPGYCPSEDGSRCEVAADMDFDNARILSSEEAAWRSHVVPGKLEDLFEPKFAPDVHVEPVQSTIEGYRRKPKKSGNADTKSKAATVPPFMKHGRSLQLTNNFRSTTKRPPKPQCKCGAHMALVLTMVVDDPTGMVTNPKTKQVLQDTLWNVLKRDASNGVKKSDIKIQYITEKETSKIGKWGRRLDHHGRRLAPGQVTVAYTIENFDSSIPPPVDKVAFQAEINNQNKASGVIAKVQTAQIGEPSVAVSIPDDGSQEMMITPKSSFVNGGDDGVVEDEATASSSGSGAAAAAIADESGGGIHPALSVFIVISVFSVVGFLAFKLKKARDVALNDPSNQDNDDMNAERSKDSDNPDFDGIELSFEKDQDADCIESVTTTHSEAGKAPDDMVRPEPDWEMPVAPEHGMLDSIIRPIVQLENALEKTIFDQFIGTGEGSGDHQLQSLGPRPGPGAS